jgi:hypothetical protein
VEAPNVQVFARVESLLVPHKLLLALQRRVTSPRAVRTTNRALCRWRRTVEAAHCAKSARVGSVIPGASINACFRNQRLIQIRPLQQSRLPAGDPSGFWDN